MKTLRRIFVLFSFLAMWPALVVEGSDSPSSAGTDRAADGPVYYHEDRHVGRDISQLVAKCPFAYYPSINQLEVAFLAPPALRRPRPDQATVRIRPAQGGLPVATGTLRLDPEGRGQDLIALPDLPYGEYAVEYIFGGKTLKSPQTFKRIHFPWEKNTLGMGHKVYPPFLPVKLAGNRVTIIERTYCLNQFGLFDSVLSQGRELLAEPMRIVCETDQGHVKWGSGTVRGSVQHEDLAVFACRAESPPCGLGQMRQQTPTGKEPLRAAVGLPELAEHLQDGGDQRQNAFLVSLADDAEPHLKRVDGRDREGDSLGNPQAIGVHEGETAAEEGFFQGGDQAAAILIATDVGQALLPRLANFFVNRGQS